MIVPAGSAQAAGALQGTLHVEARLLPAAVPFSLMDLLWQRAVCRFRERLEPFKAHLPEAAERVIEEELEKLQVHWGNSFANRCCSALLSRRGRRSCAATSCARCTAYGWAGRRAGWFVVWPAGAERVIEGELEKLQVCCAARLPAVLRSLTGRRILAGCGQYLPASCTGC